MTAFTLACWVAAGLVGVTALSGLFVTTPYGRFGGDGWRPYLPRRVGWILMEVMAVPTFVWFLLTGPRAGDPVPTFFLCLWLFHYANRAVIFPLLMKVRPGGGMSWVVSASGMVVTALHGYLNGAWLGGLSPHLDIAWFTDPRFLLGMATYAIGFALNVHSDALLRGLRDAREVSDDKGYRIPFGGGFRWVSSPHYLGELIAWTGFAIATWGPGGLFILGISAANLIPRALQTHRWYHEHFPDYPPDRRALLPGLL